MPQPKYRIGLIVDGLEVPKWVRDLVDWAKAHSAIELAAVILAPPTTSSAFDRLFTFESGFLCRRRDYRPYSNRLSIADHACLEADACDVGRVESLHLDAIVNCGSRTPPEALLGAARDGIIGISADGFAEVLEGRPDTSFAIEQFHRGGRRKALFSGSVATALLYSWNIISLKARAFTYLRTTLERLATGTAHPVEAPQQPSERHNLRDLITYGFRTVARSFKKALRRFFGNEFNWQVAFARQPWSDRRLSQATLIPNPPNAFLADPFVITVDATTYLFVEEFPFDTGKGVIAAYRLNGDAADRIGVVLDEPYHLSFPYVFEHQGEVYMVPEGGGGRSIKLYKSASFPTGWSEVKTLIDDVPAVDTCIFQHKSRWWMLTTIQGDGPGLNNAELHAFYADDLIGEWTPHSQNPIVMDARKGRNGGFLQDRNGGPCRVAQRPGFTFYGAGSAIYSIDELTPDTYRESLVREVDPTFLPALDGTHHIHCADGVTVFDFMRVERPRRKADGWLTSILKRLDAPRGFEPRLTESESVVLPLDDGAAWEAAR